MIRRLLALLLIVLLTPAPTLAQQVILAGNSANTTTTVSIGAALPAGTNNIGDVDILSIAAGDNNIGNVDIVTMPSVTIGTFPDNEPFNVAQWGGSAATAGAGAVAAGTPRITLASDDPAVVSLAILDDWDESDRAKVNLIVGQAGIAAGAGAVGATVPRVTLASDDPAVVALQLIDNLVSVEDAVAGSGFSGIGMLAVRQDAQANLAADGDFIPITVDSAGGLRVSIVAGAGSGGTSATDDAAFTVAAGTGTPAMFMFDDVSPDSINEGDVGVMRMSANRVGYFTIRDAAGNERGVNVNSSNELLVSCSGCSGTGASHIDDAAFSPGTDDGVAIFGMFDDVAPDSVNEGDGGVVRMSANRNLYVTIRDAAGNERGLNIDASGQLAVTGTVTANAGTNLNTSALALESGGNLATIAALSRAEDAAHASGHTGIMTLTVRQDTAAALAGTDADYQPLITDASGRLHVNVGNTVTVASHAVTNAGTFAVQESGAALTALQLIDNIVLAEDTASQSADPGVQLLAVRASSPANTSGTNGDYEPLQVNGGRLWVDASGVTLTVASHAVTNAGTFAVQVDGSALTSLQLLDDVVFADDAAFTPATSKISMVGFEYDDSSPDSVDEGDAGAARMSANRNIYVQLRDAAGNERGVNVNSSNELLVAVSSIPSHAVTNAGTFAVQESGSALTALQLIDNIVSVEDAVAGNAWSGVGILAVRQDSQSNLAADGDFIPVTVDSAGGLRVSVVAGGGTGGTSLADDADFTDGTTAGTPVGGVAESAAPTTVTEGDFGWFAMTLNRALKVAIFDTSGNAVTPAQDWTVSSAIGTTGPGQIIEAKDFDGAALPQTASAAEGDAIPAAGSLYGIQYVMLVSEDGSLQYGTSTTPLVVGDGSGAMNVIVDSGTVTTVSTVTSISQLGGVALPVEDAAETAGGVGIYAMSVRRDTAASSAGTTGDNATINTDASGKLWVSGAFAEDAAHTTADLGLYVLGRRIDTLAASSGTSGDYESFNMSADGALWTTNVGATNGGASIHNFASAASTNATNVKNAAGQIYGIYFVNTTATVYYLRLYNSSSSPTCSSATNYVTTVPIPASTSGAGVAVPIPIGAAFGTGISYCFTGGASSTDNTNAATGVYGFIAYK